MRIEHHYMIIPLLEKMEESGDLIFFDESENYYFLGVIDALGHGKEAHLAASKAILFLQKNHSSNPAADINGLHKNLKKTRGIVIGLFYINKNNGELVYCGIGNITLRIVGKNPHKCVFRSGIVGYYIPTLKNQKSVVYPGDIILAYSDGIKEKFDLLDIPEILLAPAENINEILMEKFSKRNDDASILTVKVNYD